MTKEEIRNMYVEYIRRRTVVNVHDVPVETLPKERVTHS